MRFKNAVELLMLKLLFNVIQEIQMGRICSRRRSKQIEENHSKDLNSVSVLHDMSTKTGTFWLKELEEILLKYQLSFNPSPF